MWFFIATITMLLWIVTGFCIPPFLFNNQFMIVSVQVSALTWTMSTNGPEWKILKSWSLHPEIPVPDSKCLPRSDQFLCGELLDLDSRLDIQVDRWCVGTEMAMYDTCEQATLSMTCSSLFFYSLFNKLSKLNVQYLWSCVSLYFNFRSILTLIITHKVTVR